MEYLFLGALATVLLYGPSFADEWKRKDEDSLTVTLVCASFTMIVFGGFAALSTMGS